MDDSDVQDPRLTEARNPRTREIDRASPREIVEMIQREDRRVPEAVAEEADAVAAMIEDVAGRMREGGRLFYVGAGTSGRLGVLDAAECPPTFGTDPTLVQGIIAGGEETLIRSREGVEDDREAGRADLRRAGVAPRDFVLGIATSGTTPYVQAAVEEADALGAGTGFLSCTPPPQAMRRHADHLVTPLVGPEVITGSTRMKAGTATKLVLNALSTGVMVRLGKVYENLMVDLRAVSRKLVGRSVRIVREAANVDGEAARRALVRAGGSAKVAIAMLGLDQSRAMAERVLDAADGFLGEALERWDEVEEVPYYGCYPAAFDPGDDAAPLLDRLREAPRVLHRSVAAAEEAGGGGPDEGEDRTRRGTSAVGGWTTGEHLAHLLECEEEVFRPRIRAVAEADEGEAPVFEDWPPTDPPPGSDRPADALLRRFREERERTLLVLDGLPGEAWSRPLEVAGEEIALHQLVRDPARPARSRAGRRRGGQRRGSGDLRRRLRCRSTWASCPARRWTGWTPPPCASRGRRRVPWRPSSWASGAAPTGTPSGGGWRRPASRPARPSCALWTPSWGAGSARRPGS